MIVVLMESQKPGSSCWAAVKGRKQVKVSGMKPGDHVRLVVESEMGFAHRVEDITEDSIIDLKLMDERLKAEHVTSSGNSKVSVDII